MERTCYNKIISLVPGGKPLKTNDGSGGKHMHGYDAEALKQAKGLPWGDPVKESTRWYQFYEHVWDFGKGFVVDGVWGTVKGLGTLVGTEGWDSMKQAWGGLADLSIGASITLVTAGAGGTYLLTTPEEELPSWLRDSSRAMKETGKALIAYDQWSENPARAGGAVTFNALTTVFTGGTGGGVSGAGKAALAGKALSFANKASRAVDPTAYLFKGAGAGLTKISDVMTGLKGSGAVEIPPLPPGTVTLPDGAYKAADGTLTLPKGAAVPEAAFEIPKGSVKLPDGAEIPTGAIDLGDGIVHLPKGMAPPTGSLPIPEGTLKFPQGTTALPEGTFRDFDAEGNVVHLDRQGNILGEDGTLKQHHTNARRENPPTGASSRTDADSPLPRTPAEQSALVGAGARGGSGAVRLDSDLGNAGRAGDDFGRTGNDATNPDRAPGGTANNLPTNSVDNGTHGGGSRGDQGGHIPANSLDGGNATGAGGRDVQGGSATDNGVPSPRNPGGSGPGGAEDAARGVDGTPMDTDHAAPHGDQTQPGPAHQANHEPPGLHGADLSENWGTHNGEPVNYATKPDEKVVAEYARIRATTEDIPRIAENYGINPEILQRAKNNLFLEKHDAYIGPGPENFKKDIYFTAYEEFSMLWKRAENGTLKDLEGTFRGLIIHEYVESRLLEAGVPNTSGHPSAWEDIRDWSNGHIGAHDIAPLSLRGAPPTARGTLALWPKMGLGIPEFTLLPDLSNLDILADAAKKGLGIQ
ncbi:hypothetical protein [Streptomyces parvus]|uniref:hypothetical protein n=1 Tax=Streptomyces parvus TaxID=66428 RepID=UPI0035E2AF4B